MHDVLRFWLSRGVDGFRIDVIYKIAKDPGLRDNEPGVPCRGLVSERRQTPVRSRAVEEYALVFISVCKA